MSGIVVVGYDGGPQAARVLERAIGEASGSRSQLVVVAVDEMPLNPEGPQNFGTLDDSPATMLPLVAPAQLATVLAAAQRQVEQAGLQGDYVWAAGEPAQEILDVARERKASVIVVGANHHGRFSRMFGGDVTDAIRHAAGCEVLVVDDA